MSQELDREPVSERVAETILIIRGERVIIDSDLAGFFGVPTKVFNQAIRRNSQRFPADFVFELTPAEKAEVVTNCDHLRKLKYSAALPLAFTEHGAIMAASVLNSPKAVEMSVYIVRAFVRMRSLLAGHRALATKLAELEAKLTVHDHQIVRIVDAIRGLMVPPEKPKRRIGFRGGES